MSKKSDPKNAEPTAALANAPTYVGVDDGFAMTKIVVLQKGQEPRTIAIPSRARSGMHGTTSIGGDDDVTGTCYETEGTMYTVEPLFNSESAKFDEYPFSGMNRSIVNHALRLAGLGGADVRIATGLPIGTFYKGGQADEGTIARKDASIRQKVITLDGKPTANIVDHQVFPEGLGAFIDYVMDDDGNVRDLDESVGVIDIGGRTTDVAVVMPGRRIDHARCGSADVGALNVVEEVALALQKEFKVDVPAGQVEQAIRTGKLKLWGKPVDIAAHVAVAAEKVVDGILREINRRLGNAVDLERVILVGGGAHVFKSVAEKYKHIVVPQAPEFANARGFAKFMAYVG